MSRCFPFPPPGYEKTVQLFETKVQLTDPVVSSKKKEKRKRHEKKDKKDRKEKKRRKKAAICNGDLQELGAWIRLPVLTDKEKHGEAELVRVKPADHLARVKPADRLVEVKPTDKLSSDEIQDLKHWLPSSSGDLARLKNGKVLLESAYQAQSFTGKAEYPLKNKEIKALVPSRDVNNGHADNQAKKHLVHSNGEDGTLGNDLKAEQSSKYKENVILFGSRQKINGQVEGHITKHLRISNEQESAALTVPPAETGSCHPPLKTVDKDQQVVDRDHDKISRSLDTNAELVDSNDSKRVDSSLTSGSRKRKRLRFKGFLEFAPPAQLDEWTADCESWLSPKNHAKNAPKPKVEMQDCTSAEGPFPAIQGSVSQGNNVEVKEDKSPQVWADAIFLPSVSIHALPYVVPY